MSAAICMPSAQAADAEYLLGKALKLAIDENSQEVAVRELLRAAQRFKKADKFQAALEFLITKGYVKRSLRINGSAKREQATVLLNPQLL